MVLYAESRRRFEPPSVLPSSSYFEHGLARNLAVHGESPFHDSLMPSTSPFEAGEALPAPRTDDAPPLTAYVAVADALPTQLK